MVKLSIVVPTRCRFDTLRHTLRTILSQDYGSFEVVVSDNFSQDATTEIVQQIKDPRLKYINTGRRVCMSENWQFALSNCSGDYVTYIGDDDGFTPGGVSIAMKHIERSGLPALIWEKAEYSWPDHIVESLRNSCTFRVSGYEQKTITASKFLKSVCQFKNCYSRLPCLYNGIVSRKLLVELSQKSKLGKLFCGICPDVMSSIVVASAISQYAFLKYPVSVNGASRHSNGTSTMRSNRTQQLEAAAMFLREQQTCYPSHVQWGPSVAICTLGEQLLAREAFPELPIPSPEYSLYLQRLQRESLTSSQHEAVYESARHTANELNLPIQAYHPPQSTTESGPTIGLRKGILSCYFSSEVVENIFDVCQMVGSITAPAAGLRNGLLPSNPIARSIASRLSRTYEKVRRHVHATSTRFTSKKNAA